MKNDLQGRGLAAVDFVQRMYRHSGRELENAAYSQYGILAKYWIDESVFRMA